MEFGGDNLHDVFMNTRQFYSVDNVRELCVGVLSGISYLHSLQIVHRDIKLNNLLLMPNSLHVKICDFGFWIKDGKTTNYIIGTKFYLAPEITLKVPIIRKAVDIWSVGCCIYVMLLRIFPFRNDNSSILFNLIQYSAFLKPMWFFNGNGGSEALEMFKGVFCTNYEQRFTIKQLQECSFFSSDSYCPVSYNYIKF